MIFLYGLLCLLAIEEAAVLIVKRMINGPFRLETGIIKQWCILKNKWRKQENAA